MSSFVVTPLRYIDIPYFDGATIYISLDLKYNGLIRWLIKLLLIYMKLQMKFATMKQSKTTFLLSLTKLNVRLSDPLPPR